jgi:dTDP-glucose 4,6-dehydratase
VSSSYWQGRKVLVTGAGGFIGSHLAEELVRRGASVRAFVHYNFQGSRGWLETSELATEMEVVSGDIIDRDSVKGAMKDVDAVFHLAALIAIPYSYAAPGSYVNANIIGTMNVLQNARELGTPRVLHTSTSEVYGTALFAPITEEHPLQGQSPYSASKIGADKMAESFYLSFNTPVVTVRPFNTFGPRQSARAVIPTIITQCLAGKKTIKLGAVSPTRDMNYVQNTAEGFIAAAESDKAIGQTINFGSGREITVGDLAHLIAKLCGTEIQIESEEQRMRPERSEVNRLLASNSKALEYTGWTPRTTLEEGLEKTIAWFRENSHRYRADIYNV